MLSRVRAFVFLASLIAVSNSSFSNELLGSKGQHHDEPTPERAWSTPLPKEKPSAPDEFCFASHSEANKAVFKVMNRLDSCVARLTFFKHFRSGQVCFRSEEWCSR